MSNFITLEDFGAENSQYYVYRCSKSAISHTPHYHDYFQICYISSGEIRHSQGNDSVTLQKGDAFIVPPGFIHSLRFLSEDAVLYCLAVNETLFQPEFVQSKALHFLKDLQSHHDFSSVNLRLNLTESQKLSILSLFDCSLREQASDYPPELSAIPSLISATINILAQSYYHNPHHSRQPWNSTDNAQLLRRCIAYVNTHCTETISSDELAKKFGLSRSALCSAFQQRTGLPIHKYITQKRIEKAQILVRTHPELTMSHIATQVGYEDDSTFYRNFLKNIGMSPSAYRELCHRKNTD